jgi:hypothetical protein
LFFIVYSEPLHMMGFSMRTNHTDENSVQSGQRLPDEADYEAAVGEIINRLSDRWRVSGKPALPETEDWFPPSRPRRGCEDC